MSWPPLRRFPNASTVRRLWRSGLPVVFGRTPTLLKYSRAALVTSGTATLETALVGTPQVVCYRANGKKLSYKIMEKLAESEVCVAAQPDSGQSAVLELLVHNCTVDSIARELSSLLRNSPQREWQVNSYKATRRKLGTSVASKYAAEPPCGFFEARSGGRCLGLRRGGGSVGCLSLLRRGCGSASTQAPPTQAADRGRGRPKTKSVAAESRKPDVADSAEQTGPPRPRPRRRKPRPRPRTETSE